MSPLRLLCVAGALYGTAIEAQARNGFSWHFGQSVPVSVSGELSQPLAYAALKDGSIVTVEFQSTSVSRYSVSGAQIWKVGRAGSGPGEFRVPYRLAVLDDETILVFDIGTATTTRLSPAGKFLGTLKSDLPISINSVLAMPNGDILMSGTTADPRGRGQALHLFGPTLKHKRSFGRLPDVTDPRLRRVVSPGTLGVHARDGFFHTVDFPHELVVYSWDLKELKRVSIPVEIDPPETWVTFATTADGRSSVRTNREAKRPRSVLQLGDDLFLGGYVSAKSSVVLFDSEGRLIDEMPQPAEWSAVATFDSRSRQLWIYGERNDEPMLFRIPVR